jgi:cyclopropane fatty-acyl-phospholipid synthase-like methyltransferase
VSRDWLTYFDHLQDSPVHGDQAAFYVESLVREVGVRSDQRVLDFGCGHGFVAARLAPLVAELWWWDPSTAMRTITKRRTARLPNARFCDLSGVSAEPQTSTWRGPRFDLILVNSVVQYMAPEELSGWLPRWREMLSPGGSVVLSDLIYPMHGSLADAIDLFRFSVRHGSPLRAAKDAFGDVAEYRRTSRAVPLVRVDAQDLARRAADAGLQTTVLPRNLTHFTKRYSAALRRLP